MLDKLSQLRKYTKGYEDMAMEGAKKAKSVYMENFAGRSPSQAGAELYDKGRRKFQDAMLATDSVEDVAIGNAAMYNAGVGALAGGAGSIGQDEGFLSSAATGAVLGGAVGGGMQRRSALMRKRGIAANNVANAQDNMGKFQSELDSLYKAKASQTSGIPFVDGASKRRFNDRIAVAKDNIKAEGKVLESNKDILSGKAVSNWKYGTLAGGGVLAHNILDGNDPLSF